MKRWLKTSSQSQRVLLALRLAVDAEEELGVVPRSMPLGPYMPMKATVMSGPTFSFGITRS